MRRTITSENGVQRFCVEDDAMRDVLNPDISSGSAWVSLLSRGIAILARKGARMDPGEMMNRFRELNWAQRLR